MSQLEKLITRIRARPPEADFADVEKLLEAFGWQPQQPGRGGSHVIFRKAGEYPIAVPKKGGRKVIRVYLEQICERLGLDE